MKNKKNQLDIQPESKVPIKKSLVFINSISGLITKIFSLSILIWLQHYLIQRIPPEEYSLYPVFVSILMFLLIVKSVFTGGIARYLIAARTKNDDKRISEIVSSTFVLNISVALIILVIGLPLASMIEKIIVVDKAYIQDSRLIMTIMVVSLSVRLAFASFESGLIVEQRFVLINIINLCQILFRFVLLLILLVGISPRVIWVAVATEITNLFGLIILGIVSRRILPSMRFNFSSVNLKTLHHLLNFGVWSFFGQIANRIRTFSDPLILNQLSNPYNVTIFYLGSLIPKQLYAILERMTQSILPSLTAMYETGQFERLSRTYIRYGRIVLWIFLFIGTPLLVLYKEIMALYTGNIYTEAGLVLFILLVAGVIEQSYIAVHRIAYATVNMRTLSLLALIAQLSNLLLTIVLVGQFKMGALGSAISTLSIRVIVELPMFSVFGVGMLKISYIKWVLETLIRGLIPMVISLPLIFFIHLQFPIATWWGVFYQSTIGVVAYLLSLFFLAATRKDKSDILKLISWIKYSLRLEKK